MLIEKKEMKKGTTASIERSVERKEINNICRTASLSERSEANDHVPFKILLCIYIYIYIHIYACLQHKQRWHKTGRLRKRVLQLHKL